MTDTAAKRTRKGANDGQYCPVSPGATRGTGEGLSGVPRRGCDGQMAPAKRLYGQGSPHGRQSRRHLQDVVHEFHHGAQPLFRRKVSRTGTERADSAHRQIRRSEPARRDANDDHLEESLLRNRAECRARGDTGGYPTGGLLSGLAGVTHPPGAARRGRDFRLGSGLDELMQLGGGCIDDHLRSRGQALTQELEGLGIVPTYFMDVTEIAGEAPLGPQVTAAGRFRENFGVVVRSLPYLLGLEEIASRPRIEGLRRTVSDPGG